MIVKLAYLALLKLLTDLQLILAKICLHGSIVLFVLILDAKVCVCLGRAVGYRYGEIDR